MVALGQGEVFAASLYGWLAFGEVLSGLDIAGMVLVGAALAVSRERGQSLEWNVTVQVFISARRWIALCVTNLSAFISL